ncbi:geranylgeranyl reductase, partial [Streptomyces sp. NPDC006482]
MSSEHVENAGPENAANTADAADIPDAADTPGAPVPEGAVPEDVGADEAAEVWDVVVVGAGPAGASAA